jgi:ribonucleotide monophosphatase NagD (HAD superfamily)
MIGDNPVANIKGANAAGIPTKLVNNDFIYTANYVCECLTDVLKIIQ